MPLVAPAEAGYSGQNQEAVSNRGSILWVLVAVFHFNPFDTLLFSCTCDFLVLGVSVSCRRR